MKELLRWAGRNGALIVIAGVVIGLVVPQAAALARPYLAVAIFVFTFGSFLKFDSRALSVELSQVARNGMIVIWATLGIPVLVCLLIAVFHPGAELAQGLLFWAIVPASPACVAFAAILRLNIPLALITTVAGTAVSPLYIPALAAALGGYQVSLDPWETCLRLALLIGGAYAVSVATRRLAGDFVRQNPEAVTGISVLAMFLAGMGSMRGMQAHLIAEPAQALGFVALAYATLFGAEILGTLLFWRFGRETAFTAGLVSGTRTITLAWVILGDKVLPLADLFLAAGMVAKYTAPGLTKGLLTRLLASAPSLTTPAPVVAPEAPSGTAPGV